MWPRPVPFTPTLGTLSAPLVTMGVGYPLFSLVPRECRAGLSLEGWEACSPGHPPAPRPTPCSSLSLWFAHCHSLTPTHLGFRSPAQPQLRGSPGDV